MVHLVPFYLLIIYSTTTHTCTYTRNTVPLLFLVHPRLFFSFPLFGGVKRLAPSQNDWKEAQFQKKKQKTLRTPLCPSPSSAVFRPSTRKEKRRNGRNKRMRWRREDGVRLHRCVCVCHTHWNEAASFFERSDCTSGLRVNALHLQQLTSCLLWSGWILIILLAHTTSTFLSFFFLLIVVYYCSTGSSKVYLAI